MFKDWFGQGIFEEADKGTGSGGSAPAGGNAPTGSDTGTNPASGATGTTGATGEAAPVEFTPEQQAAVDKIVADRLKRDREKAAAEQAERERLAKLSAEERVKAEKAAAEKRAEEAEARAIAAERRASIAGKVSNPDAALKLLEDKHLAADGSVNVAAFLKDHPYLAPNYQPTTASGGAGGQHQRNTPEPDSFAAALEADRRAGRI